MVNISLNGKPQQMPDGTTVSGLLSKWKIKPELVTVEVNEEILQKLDYEAAALKEGDKINFVFYMGGGA